MARITAPNGETMPDTDNPGLLAYYRRHGYTIHQSEPEPDEAPELAEAPNQSAHKAAWVAWAVANGADQGEAEAMTKDDLIAAYDQPDDE